MKSEAEVRKMLEDVEERLENAYSPDLTHLIGYRNALREVLEEE